MIFERLVDALAHRLNKRSAATKNDDHLAGAFVCCNSDAFVAAVWSVLVTD